jgi:hypothetical protein
MRSLSTIALPLALVFLASPIWADEEPAATEVTETTSESDEGTEAEEADASVEAEEEEAKDWSVAVTLLTSVSQGTFADVSNDSEWAGQIDDGDNAFDRVNLVYDFSGSYTLGDFSLSSGLTWVQWLTDGGGYNGPGEVRFQDVPLGIDWAGHSFESTGISVSSGVSFGFPASETSQVSTLIVGTGIYASLRRRFLDTVGVSLTLSGGKDFHEYKGPVVDQKEVDAIARSGGSEVLGEGLILVDGINTEYSLGGSLGVSFGIWEKLSGSVSYSFTNYWSYDWENDDVMTSPRAETGRGIAQRTDARFNLSYPVMDYLTVALSARTYQSPKTDDNQSFRFPFWNTTGAARNYSSLRLALVGSY